MSAARVLAVLEAWERARGRPAYRAGGVALGLALAGAVLLAPRPDGLSAEGQAAAAVTLLMGFWWLGGVLPMAVTAMVPLVAYPLLGVLSGRDAAAPYADPLIFLMLGGMVLAWAMEEVGLHRRITAALLAPEAVRRSPERVVFALMVATAAVSSFVNNTAAMLMMLPLALGLAAHVGDDRRVRAAFVLSTAYAASIGGVATLVGTAPNAVFAGLLPKVSGREVGFLEWMLVGVPFVGLAIPTAWWVVNRFALPLPSGSGARVPPAPPPAREEGQAVTTAVLLACFVLWLTRSSVDLGWVEWRGWGRLLPVRIDDSFVAVAGSMVLFLIPRRAPRAEADRPGDDGAEARFLFSWRRASRALPWSVLLLLGGGYAMAAGLTSSGLADWAAGGLGGLAALPGPVAVLGISVGVAFLSAFTSNTATTQMVLPLLGAAANQAGVDPVVWMLPATISASCDFTLAVGTPPNAIAAESGGVSQADMAFAGVTLNLLCAVLATAVAVAVAPAVFG